MAPGGPNPHAVQAQVDKATSELLNGPDWGMNMELCDMVNTQGDLTAKEVVKALKKRLGHKSPKVQMLALTVFETGMKNCGEMFHFQVVHKEVLQEMSKIATKRTVDPKVRKQILVLLQSWGEAFGPTNVHPQFHEAYVSMQRKVEFPVRPSDTAPVFTPTTRGPTHLPPPGAARSFPSPDLYLSHPQSSTAETTNLKREVLVGKNSVDVLDDMLNSVNDPEALKGDVIVELVGQCERLKPRLLQLVNTVTDEGLLNQALSLHDELEVVLKKHDDIANGRPTTRATAAPVAAPPAISPASAPPLDVDLLTGGTPALALTAASHSMGDEEFEQLAKRKEPPQYQQQQQAVVLPAMFNTPPSTSFPAPESHVGPSTHFGASAVGFQSDNQYGTSTSQFGTPSVRSSFDSTAAQFGSAGDLSTTRASFDTTASYANPQYSEHAVQQVPVPKPSNPFAQPTGGQASYPQTESYTVYGSLPSGGQFQGADQLYSRQANYAPPVQEPLMLTNQPYGSAPYDTYAIPPMEAPSSNPFLNPAAAVPSSGANMQSAQGGGNMYGYALPSLPVAKPTDLKAVGGIPDFLAKPDKPVAPMGTSMKSMRPPNQSDAVADEFEQLALSRSGAGGGQYITAGQQQQQQQQVNAGPAGAPQPNYAGQFDAYMNRSTAYG
eukprot:jgi/Chlat1/2714/Chrsp180S02879